MKRTLWPAALLSAVLVLCVTAIAVAAASPSVTTGPRSHVTDTSVELHGTINPNGRKTAYFFEWGVTAAYGATSSEHSAGRGTRPVSVATTASALIPGTLYHYRLIAANAAGSATGADRTFKTAGNPPPVVATGPVSAVGQNSATLTAEVSPNKQATTYYFQYGPSAAYGSQTIAATVPAGTAPVIVTASVQGLEARTIFHYRIIAFHDNTAPQPGLDATFMTLPRHRPVPRIHARTRPRHAAHAPFVLTTTGSVRGPAWIPGVYDCRGNVSIRFFRGSRRIANTLVPLGANCTFTGQTVFNKHPGHRRGPVAITVVVHYLGNFYLTPRKTSGQTITLG